MHKFHPPVFFVMFDMGPTVYGYIKLPAVKTEFSRESNPYHPFIIYCTYMLVDVYSKCTYVNIPYLFFDM